MNISLRVQRRWSSLEFAGRRLELVIGDATDIGQQFAQQILIKSTQHHGARQVSYKRSLKHALKSKANHRKSMEAQRTTLSSSDTGHQTARDSKPKTACCRCDKLCSALAAIRLQHPNALKHYRCNATIAVRQRALLHKSTIAVCSECCWFHTIGIVEMSASYSTTLPSPSVMVFFAASIDVT